MRRSARRGFIGDREQQQGGLDLRRPGCAHVSTKRENEGMAESKFKVGQMVDFRPGKGAVPASSRGYEILRLMPPTGGERLYRIKTVSELFERVARESELARVQTS